MEEHLRNRDRLDADWEELNAYESEEAVPCEAARRSENACKNRAGCPIPCKFPIYIENIKKKRNYGISVLKSRLLHTSSCR